MNDCLPSVYSYQLARTPSGVLVDPNGPVDCAAHALAMGLYFDSCGAIDIDGARVRQLTNEPHPDPSSPGLKHSQLVDVAAKFGVRIELLSGAPWDEVDDAQRTGHAVLLAVNYRSIRGTSFSGQRSFYGNHELILFEDWFTFDPLADGRISNGQRVFRGPATYPESVLEIAAGEFVTRYGKTGRILERLGFGRAVAAVLPHAHPNNPDTPPPPVVVPGQPYDGKEGNVAILAAYSGHTYRMAKGQKLYRSPAGVHVTTLAKAGSVEYVGKAGAGWVAVKVGTGALYPDHIVRPTVLYAPAGAGVLE